MAPRAPIAPLALPVLLGVLLCAGSTLVASCASGPSKAQEAALAAAPAEIATARRELSQGRAQEALDRLIELRELPGLPPEQRNDVEALLVQAAESALDALAARGADPDDFEEIYDLELPGRLGVEAGIATARALLDRGERIDSYELLREIEDDHPVHHARSEAAELLSAIGQDLARDDGRYGLFFTFKGKAVEVLEFLVLSYPSSPRCDEAYHTLALLYEERELFGSAIERYQDLVLYHPDSSYAPASELRVPELRLRRLARVDYDRSEMVQALREVVAWLDRHPRHELLDEAKELERSCYAWLAASDISIARYYERIEESFGARLYAERALAEARQSSDPDRVEEALAVLASLPEAAPAVEAEAAEAGTPSLPPTPVAGQGNP